MIRSTSPSRSPCSAWKMALCSLSTGISRVPCAAQVRFSSSPAQTMLSLLASASTPPCSREPQPRRQPRRADDRRHRPVHRLRRPPRAAPPAPPPPRCRCPRAPARARPAGRRRPSPPPRPRAACACSASSAMLPAPVSATTSKASAPPWASISETVLLADRAGRAEDADPPPRHLKSRTCRCRGCRRWRRTRRRPSPRPAGPSPRRARGSAGSRPSPRTAASPPTRAGRRAGRRPRSRG